MSLHAQDHLSTSSTPAPAAVATLGGGCFWCMEAVFENVPGVLDVVSGYAGGTTNNPRYPDVCSGRTGHAEVVQIRFDPAVISYEQLLEIFWQAHNPTTLNSQGADHGTQYRSIILTHDEAQRAAAEASLKKAQGRWNVPIVTQIVPLTRFSPAEKEHQDYFKLHPGQGYCAVVIAPKLEHLRQDAVIP